MFAAIVCGLQVLVGFICYFVRLGLLVCGFVVCVVLHLLPGFGELMLVFVFVWI